MEPATEDVVPVPLAQRPYNIKWGDLEGNLRASVVAGYDSNVALSSVNREDDFFAGPALGIGFIWPWTANTRLQFDVSGGYKWYFNNPQLDTWHLSSDSAIALEAELEGVRLRLENRFSIVDDPTVRPEIFGTGAELVEYRMFSNTTGLSADGQPYDDLLLSGGYDFTLSRSLSDQFSTLDMNQHRVNAAANYVLSPAWRAGLQGNIRWFDYLESLQNDGWIASFGPMFTYVPNEFWSVTADAGYTVSEFDTTGSLVDTADFSGWTGGLSVGHRLTERVRHSLAYRHSVDPGYNSNFSEQHGVNYSVSADLARRWSARAGLGYNHLQQSGDVGDNANLYSASASVDHALTTRWSTSLSYSFSYRDSEFGESRSYDTHRVTLRITRQL